MTSSLQAELKQNKPFSSLETELFIGLLRTVDLMGRTPVALLKGKDLSSAQYNVLRILRGAGEEGLPCGEVGSRMVTRDPDVTRLLDRLETRGLVLRQRDTADRRIITARITPAGLALLLTLDQPLLDLQKQQLGCLEKKDIEAMLASLERIRNHLKTLE